MGVRLEKELLRSSFTKIAEELKKDRSFNTGVISVHTRLLENVKSEAVVGGHGKGYEKSHRLISDERELLGGGDEGPAPLEYFISGFNFCLQSTLVYWSTSLDVPIQSMEMKTRAYWNRRGNYIEGDPAFTKIAYELSIESPAEESRIRELVDTAERRCVVHSTLKKAVPIESHVTLNGRKLN